MSVRFVIGSKPVGRGLYVPTIKVYDGRMFMWKEYLQPPRHSHQGAIDAARHEAKKIAAELQ